ncbi:MAG: type II toxin-antitoxin system VapC family toxin [Chloroflexi bacterium]|nr:type II toxin-antitoxin system VapC family toxin [Chloroflexota bacterium]
MIIDSSAIASILFMESDSGHFSAKIADSWPRRMSVASLLESTMVVEGRTGSSSHFDVDDLLEEYEIELVPVSVEQAQAARIAWRRFGKGNHPARLNFGDCFSYVLAKTTGEPLLFKGDDFAQTDIQAA